MEEVCGLSALYTFSLFSFRNVCGVRLDKDGREGRDKGGGIGRPLCLTTRMEA